MFKLLLANKIRLKKSKLFWSGVFITVGYCLLLLMLNYIEMISHVGNSIMLVDWYLLAPFSVLSFFCPIFCSMFIGTEYSDGTIRNRLIVGHTRKSIYLSNFFTVSFACVIITIIASLVVTIFYVIFFGWNISNPMTFILYYFCGLLMLIAMSGLFSLIAMLISNKSSSLLVCIMICLSSFVLENIVKTWIFNGFDEGIFPKAKIFHSQFISELLYDVIPMGQCLQITGEMVFHPFRLPLYSLLFIIITLVCGIWFFEKKDLK